MEAQIERRAGARPRLPVDLMVELSHEGDEDIYEADAFDVGPGGMGLRASVLPEVGQRLRCRFDLGTDEPCEAWGEVVWAHDSGRFRGSFGVRFDALDPAAQDVLEELAPEPSGSDAPRTVRVKLDGVAGAIEGDLVSEGAPIVIEQAMPIFRIGRGAELEGARRAVIERVRLRVEDGVPRLVLELAPEGAVAAEQVQAVASDSTVQDAPLEELLARAEARERDGADERDVHQSAPAEEPFEDVSSGELRDIAVSERAALPAQASAAPSPEAALLQRLRAFVLAQRPHAERAIALARAAREAASRTLGPLASALRARGLELARTTITLIAERFPAIGALIGYVPRRRTSLPPTRATQAPARGSKARPEAEVGISRGRLIAIVGAACLAVLLAEYGLAGIASSSGDEPPPIETHVPVSTGSWAETAESAVPEITPVTTAEVIEPLPPPEPSGGPIDPPSFPSLAARRAGAVEAAEAASSAMEFGAPSVERGRTFTLRMSHDVQALEGIADPGGFTVTALGALSLDRARPIEAAMPSVERAAIQNSSANNQAVLTIRFVEGRAVPYRVVARGSFLDVTIGR